MIGMRPATTALRREDQGWRRLTWAVNGSRATARAVPEETPCRAGPSTSEVLEVFSILLRRNPPGVAAGAPGRRWTVGVEWVGRIRRRGAPPGSRRRWLRDRLPRIVAMGAEFRHSGSAPRWSAVGSGPSRRDGAPSPWPPPRWRAAGGPGPGARRSEE